MQTWKKRANEDTSPLSRVERIRQLISFSTLSTDDRPTLPQLMFLKCPDGTIIRIIDETNHKLDKLALAGLDFKGNELETIKQKSFYKPDSACQELLHDWLQGRAKQPVTWRTLIEALERANFSELVRELNKAFNLQPVESTTGEFLIPKVRNLQTLCSKQ